MFAELAADVYARGDTLAAHWQRLRQRYGAFEFRSGYFVASPPSRSAAVFERLRAAPPAAIGGCPVRAVRDLGTGVDTSQPGGSGSCILCGAAAGVGKGRTPHARGGAACLRASCCWARRSQLVASLRAPVSPPGPLLQTAGRCCPGRRATS